MKNRVPREAVSVAQNYAFQSPIRPLIFVNDARIGRMLLKGLFLSGGNTRGLGAICRSHVLILISPHGQDQPAWASGRRTWPMALCADVAPAPAHRWTLTGKTMDFALTPRMLEMQSHLQVFIDRRILPANVEWHREVEAGRYPTPLLETVMVM